MNNNNGKRPGGNAPKPVLPQNANNPRSPGQNGIGSRPAIRRVRRRSFAGPIIAALVMTVIVIIAIVFLVMLLTGKLEFPGGGADTNSNGPESSDTTAAQTQDSADTSGGVVTDAQTAAQTDAVTTAETQPPVQVATGYKTISVANTGVHTGDLILVNYQNAFIFPDKKNTTVIYGNKNSSYKLSTSQLEVTSDTLSALNAMMLAYSAESNNYDVFVKNAYRSLADQQSLYDARVAAYGEDNAKKYLAQPGYSEHHTGLCFDLGIYTDDGTSYELDGKSGYADWFSDNCAKYGFVLRYPSAKSAITGVTGETWHFRYVGQAHAETMNALGLCLEEYVDKLREYPYSGEHLIVTTTDGKKYEIYYQYASIADTTDVPVPENLSYTISGDNSQGFIITVALSS
jgi:D-alanyl-D-alanine carboxypeptidase